MKAIEVKEISKSFGPVQAVQKASFSVPYGSVFGLLGRNGAGKTTAIRMMMNIYKPDSGTISLASREGIEGTPDTMRDRIGYLPEERGLYKKMTVQDTLAFFAELKGVSRHASAPNIGTYLEQFDLANRRLSKIEELSKGNQQKIQFIATVLHNPDIIVLDEPFSGLDPININTVKELILSMKRAGKAVILSTHLMDFAEKLCDSIAMIDSGKVIMEGNLSHIRRRFSERNVTVMHEGDLGFLHNNPLVENISSFGNRTTITLTQAGTEQKILQELVRAEIPIRRYDTTDMPLQEIFTRVVGKAPNESTSDTPENPADNPEERTNA